MAVTSTTNDIDDLRGRIAELEETLDAIRGGGVDAVLGGPAGSERIYTLTSAERPYREIVEHMSEGALTVSDTGIVLYANPRLLALLGSATSEVVGQHLDRFVPGGIAALRQCVPRDHGSPSAQYNGIDTDLVGAASATPVRIFTSRLETDGVGTHCLVVTDRSRDADRQAILEEAVSERTADLAHVNASLVSATRTLQVVTLADRALIRAGANTELMQTICDIIVDTGRYPLAWVGTATEDTTCAVVPVAAAGRVSYLKHLTVTWGPDLLGRGPTGTAIRTRMTNVVNELHAAPEFAPWAKRAAKFGFRSVCALPVGSNQDFRGSITIFSRDPFAFTETDVEMLESLADDLTFGLSRLADAERLRGSVTRTAGALAAAAELRDPYTAGHQHRVSLLTNAIADRLGCSPSEIEGMELAATIHDIGKLVVPAEILSKPTRLLDEEMQLVRRHARAGYDILAPIDFPWPVATMVRQHHERLDGSGYPDGASGADILLGSRIIAVADIVEAMASHRPYRPALGVGTALAAIEFAAGKTLDATVVTACCELFRYAGFDFENRESARHE